MLAHWAKASIIDRLLPSSMTKVLLERIYAYLGNLLVNFIMIKELISLSRCFNKSAQFGQFYNIFTALTTLNSLVWSNTLTAFSSLQSLSRVRLFVTPWTAARQASLSITNSWSLPKSMSIESVTPSNYLILCLHRLLLPSIFPSIRVFSNESALCIRWPKYWSFSFNISPSNEHPGLISFRMDWLDLLAVQGTLKSLLQHHNSKVSILWHSAFFTVQLSHPYVTTEKP